MHRNILEVAKFFDRFCQDHDLQYFLLGGTALGALRHGGFIPWDDDFDICMLVEDYEKLLKLKDPLSEKGYHLQIENTTEWPLFFSKLRLNNSLYLEREDSGRTMHNGIYIDIMCISPGYDNLILRYSQYLAAKILSASALADRGYRPSTFTKKAAMFFATNLCNSWVRSKLLRFIRCCSPIARSGRFYNHFFGRAPFRHACIHNKHFVRPIKVQFENHSFQAMTAVEDYLDTRFGAGWRELPNKAVRDSFPAHCMRFEAHPDFIDPL
ncbi:MAG: LicD family protein [Candidatus Paceibacterota bacterium]